ncbi:MAG: hypothetical protein HYY06_01335 [Deltaproteobacteria bacterium]|nr:hypothetical protein [Deltaproteobacteria bacterium]
MVTIVLAALVSIVPTEPPRLRNDLDVAVTHVRVGGPSGSVRTIGKLAGRHEVVVPLATGVASYEIAECGAELRAVIAREGNEVDRVACVNALAPDSPTIRGAVEAGRAPALARVIFERVDGSSARELLPEIVGLEVEGGELGQIVAGKLADLYLSTPMQQLRAVDRARRPDLLTQLGRHEDGRAFGILVRAALESSIERERLAASEALADYPDDAVARLGEALDDRSPVVRARAEAALRQQDGRARDALVAAIAVLGGRTWDDGTPIEYAQELIRAHSERRAVQSRSLVAQAREALASGSAGQADDALRALQRLDHPSWTAERTLRAAVAVAVARDAIGQGDLRTSGATAVERLFAADALHPDSPGLVETALEVAGAYSKAGYPASASRVLAPFEHRDARVARRRARALEDEIGRLMQAGDKSAARLRLAQLVEEGHSDLAQTLDDEFSVRGDSAWVAFPAMSLVVCGCIGFAVRRERRRRRAEFRLIETEQDRGLYHEGVYR